VKDPDLLTEGRTELCFTAGDIVDFTLATKIAKALKENPFFKSLSLDQCKIEPESLLTLVSACLCSTLTKLTLKRVGLSTLDCNTIMQNVTHQQREIVLSLSSGGQSNDPVTANALDTLRLGLGHDVMPHKLTAGSGWANYHEQRPPQTRVITE
jgi:hypothetical protein